MSQNELIAKHCLEFQRELNSGNVSALDYWSRLNDHAAELLQALLLVELEHAHWRRGLLGTCADTLTRIGAAKSAIDEFVVEAYTSQIELGLSPSRDEFEPLVELQRLKFSFDPFHLGQVFDDKYRIEQRIAHGSFSVVFRVVDLSNGTLVACKTPKVMADGSINPRVAELLKAEAKAMQTLGGAGCPKSYMSLTFDGFPCLLMQFIDGPSLRDIIFAGPVEVEEAARIMLSIAETVWNAHQHRIVHRDLKPENILLDSTGNVYVTDFGLVIFNDDHQLERKGEQYGTRGYMPPDSILGFSDELDGRADIFSLGIIAMQLVGGETNASTRTKEEALVAAICAAANRIEWPANVPQRYKSIVETCVQPNPLHRYSNAADVAKAFATVGTNPRSNLKRDPRLSAWRMGIEYGKFNHLFSVGDSNIELAAGPSDRGSNAQIAAAMLFGAQEAASDIRKLISKYAAECDLDDRNWLGQIVDSYPKKAADNMRVAFYSRGQPKGDLKVNKSQLNSWISSSFDQMQSHFQALGIDVHALFEFGVLAAQAQNLLLTSVPNMLGCAAKTGLPTTIYLHFCNLMEDRNRGDVNAEYKKLKREVELHLQDEQLQDEV